MVRQRGDMDTAQVAHIQDDGTALPGQGSVDTEHITELADERVRPHGYLVIAEEQEAADIRLRQRGDSDGLVDAGQLGGIDQTGDVHEIRGAGDHAYHVADGNLDDRVLLALRDGILHVALPDIQERLSAEPVDGLAAERRGRQALMHGCGERIGGAIEHAGEPLDVQLTAEAGSEAERCGEIRYVSGHVGTPSFVLGCLAFLFLDSIIYTKSFAVMPIPCISIDSTQKCPHIFGIHAGIGRYRQ